MNTHALDALSAGVKALPKSRQRASQVFAMAIEAEPDMADAWLGRVAAGDHSVNTLAALVGVARWIGRDLPAVGMSVAQVGARHDLEHIQFDIVDETTARIAYAGALISAGDLAAADEVLRQTGSTNLAAYARGVLAWRAQRWPDVLAAVQGCETWLDLHLGRAASLLEGWSAANLGLFEQAERAAALAQKSPNPFVVRDGAFCSALVARTRGDEDTARQLLTDVRVRWPDFDLAKQALADPTYAIKVTDQATIDTRTDPWDPATATDPDEAKRQKHAVEREQLLETADVELAKQIGLHQVKHEVAKLKAITQMNDARVAKGLPPAVRSNHLIFTGPPGTGKTTIARIVAQIYCGLGVLATAKVVEANRSSFVASHLGQTALKTNALIDSALDGILFIDEAYTLIQEGLSGGDAFGREAVDTLLARMENERSRFMVIIAGYDFEIDRFLAANEGLASRFQKRIAFPSYTPGELVEIGALFASSTESTLSAEAATLLGDTCRYLAGHETSTPPSGSNGFAPQRRPMIDVVGNARFIRNVVQGALEELALRSVKNGNVNELDEAAMTTITASDIEAALLSALRVAMPSEFLAGLPSSS
jgi:type VII secretion ATPase EccA